MANRPVYVPPGQDPVNYYTRCAEGEGGRARLAIEGYGHADTAAYFAREAAHYAGVLLTWEAEGEEEPVQGYRPEGAVMYDGTPGSASWHRALMPCPNCGDVRRVDQSCLCYDGGQ
jgi:hypothetical protein